jgi:hypothetical protein
MIIGAHIMLQSRDDKADQAFLTEVLKLASVEEGDGFLIFGLPPAEVAIHEADKNDIHQLFLMCDDIHAFVADMEQRGISTTPPANRGWGTLTEITLPGGGMLGVYQPHHKRPKAKAVAAKKKKAPARKAAKKPAKKNAKNAAKKKKKAKRR